MFAWKSLPDRPSPVRFLKLAIYNPAYNAANNWDFLVVFVINQYVFFFNIGF